MNLINGCITIRKSISKLNGFIGSTASLKPTLSSNLIINKRGFSTSSSSSDNDISESDESYYETEKTEVDQDDIDLQITGANFIVEKNIKEVTKKISEFYTPQPEKIKLEQFESKNVTPLLKCIYLNNKANQLIGEGRFDDAETILIGGISLYESSNQDSMPLRTSELGITTHQCIGYLLSNLAYVHHVKGLFVDSIKNYTKSLSYLESQEDVPFYGNTLLHLSELFSLLQDNLKAIETCKKAISIFEDTKEYLVDDRIGLALLNLSSYLSIEGKYKEALPHCQKAFTMLEKSLGRNNEMVQGCATNLSKLYQQLDMKEEQSQLDELFENPLESSLKFNFDFKKDLPHIDLSKLKKEWSEQGHQRVFDIEGFYKSSATSKREFESFLEQLESQGVKYGPETSSILKPELESIAYAPDVIRKWKPLTFSLNQDGEIQKNI
ncbi:hypothetical protein RB653_007275 [Dictyostelium firmibasis]|uniref:Uncharacterized protein n=1 Tax=Dictyostelium firmibasis TaxID=79012 RepID=A0AAN7TNF3_9MYCE